MIPRDCNDEFSTALLPFYARRDDHLEAMVIKLYQIINMPMNDCLYKIIK